MNKLERTTMNRHRKPAARIHVGGRDKQTKYLPDLTLPPTGRTVEAARLAAELEQLKGLALRADRPGRRR